MTPTTPRPEAALSFDDALRIARGCTDYRGGFDGAEYEAFQSGVQTVVASLTAAAKHGLTDTQVRALHVMGQVPA